MDSHKSELEVVTSVAARMARLEERINALDKLMESKFVTYRTLLDSNAEKVRLALDAAEKAISKAEIATEKRFDSVNEFRAALSDQTRTFVTRTAFDAEFQQSRTDRANIHQQIGDLVTREYLEATKDSALVKATEIDRRMQDLRNAQTRIAGVAIGVSAAISVVATLVALVFRLATGS